MFLIDGDFEWLRAEPPPNIPGLVRVDAYCIENLLLDSRAIIQIVMEEAVLTEDQAAACLDFQSWLKTIDPSLVDLFIAFAALNLADRTQPTVGEGVGSVVAQEGRASRIDQSKVEALRRQKIEHGARTLGKEKFDALLVAVRQRVDALPDRLHAVSGKHFLIPLLQFRLRECCSGFVPRTQPLRIRLVRHCNVERFSCIARALEALA